MLQSLRDDLFSRITDLRRLSAHLISPDSDFRSAGHSVRDYSEPLQLEGTVESVWSSESEPVELEHLSDGSLGSVISAHLSHSAPLTTLEDALAPYPENEIVTGWARRLLFWVSLDDLITVVDGDWLNSIDADDESRTDFINREVASIGVPANASLRISYNDIEAQAQDMLDNILEPGSDEFIDLQADLSSEEDEIQSDIGLLTRILVRTILVTIDKVDVDMFPDYDIKLDGSVSAPEDDDQWDD